MRVFTRKHNIYDVSFGGGVSKNDIDLTGASPDLSAILAQLAAQKATVQVYDDSNTLLYSAELGLNETTGGQLSGMVSGI